MLKKIKHFYNKFSLVLRFVFLATIIITLFFVFIDGIIENNFIFNNEVYNKISFSILEQYLIATTSILLFYEPLFFYFLRFCNSFDGQWWVNDQRVGEIAFNIVLLCVSLYLGVGLGNYFYKNYNNLFKPQDVQIISFFAVSSLIILLLLLIHIFILREQKRRKEEKKNSRINLIDDKPIQRIEEDMLNRYSLIKSVTNEIVANSGGSVIGIEGEWGDGKTSVLNILGNDLGEKDYTVIFFNPWKYGNKETLLEGLFNEVTVQFQKRYFYLFVKKSISKYLRLLEGQESFLMKLIAPLLQDVSINVLYSEIENYISSTHRKVIVFIDDADRLSSDDLYKLLTIIKATANIENFTYVIAYDKASIDHTLKKWCYNPNKYWQKFVQTEIPLGLITDIELLEVFDGIIQQLLPLLEEYNMLDAKDKLNELKEFIRTEMSGFGNVRLLKRFLNTFVSNIVPILDEVNIVDYARIKLLQLDYPAIYKDIGEYPYVYLGKWYRGFVENFSHTEDKKRREAMKEHIEKKFKEYPETKERGVKLLSSLFWDVHNAYLGASFGGSEPNPDKYVVEKRIASPDILRKVYLGRLLPSDIPNDLVWSFINNLSEASSVEEHESIINKAEEELVSKGLELKDFYDLMSTHKESIPVESISNHVLALFGGLRKYPMKKEEDFKFSLYESIYWYGFALIDRLEDEDKIGELLTKVIKEIDDPRLIASIPLHTQSSRGGGTYNIYRYTDKQEHFNSLVDLADKRLTELVINKKIDLFEMYETDKTWVFILYQWELLWETVDENQKKVVDYTLDMLNSLDRLDQFIQYRFVAQFVSRREKKSMSFNKSGRMAYAKPIYTKVLKYINDGQETENLLIYREDYQKTFGNKKESVRY